MSADQFSALPAQLQEDSWLMEKLSDAADLDAAVAIAKEAGFDVTQDDLNNHQASQESITSEDLASIGGGKGRINCIPTSDKALNECRNALVGLNQFATK
jgi:predicted ribosomally synthesized peptide with nif11-like leader